MINIAAICYYKLRIIKINLLSARVGWDTAQEIQLSGKIVTILYNHFELLFHWRVPHTALESRNKFVWYLCLSVGWSK